MLSRSTTGSPTDIAVPIPAGISRIRVTLVAAVLALGAAAVAVFFLWSPGPNRDDFSYASIAPVRQAAFVGYLIDSVGFGLVAVGLAVAMCLLVRARGAACANVGAILVTVGGVLVAISSFALACLRWYATSTSAISADSGTALLAYFKHNEAPIAGPQVGGFLAFNVGVLLFVVALWRSHAVPRWLPIAMTVLTLAQFAGIPDRALDFVQVADMATLIVIAGYVTRIAPRSADSSVTP
jgi:hypothetical protein